MRCLLVLLLLLATVSAQELGAAWEEGRHQEILEAIDLRIAAGAEVDAELLHDRGNCLFRLGRYPEAALAYRRSLLRSGHDEETAFNLKLCERRLGFIEEEAGFGRLLLTRYLALEDAAQLLLLLFFECAALLVMVLGRRRRALVLLGLLLLVPVVVGARSLRGTGPRTGRLEAVVLSEGSSLRTEPRASGQGLLDLKPGERLVVEARSDRWLRVRRGQTSGYVPRDDLGLVD